MLVKTSDVTVVLHYILFFLGVRFHDFHHKNFNGNYSSSFQWWDWLFGTDRQYKEFVAAQEETKKKE